MTAHQDEPPLRARRIGNRPRGGGGRHDRLSRDRPRAAHGIEKDSDFDSRPSDRGLETALDLLKALVEPAPLVPELILRPP